MFGSRFLSEPGMRRAGWSLALVVGLTSSVSSAVSQSLHYPATRRDTVVENYFGTKVPAPYRWMEDQNSPEVAAWVDSENAVTFSYLGLIPLRDTFRARLSVLWNHERVSVPGRARRGGPLFFTKNSGLQSQSPVYEQSGLTGPMTLVLDPNTLSTDGSVALAGWTVSPDGRWLAYDLSPGGSDWRELHVRNLVTGKDLADTVHWAKFADAVWTNDGQGFFYSRYPAPPAGQLLTAASANQKIFYHVVGTPDSTDRLIYERPDLPQWYMGPQVTEDGRFLFIYLSFATDANEVYYADLRDPLHPNVSAPIRPLFPANDANYGVVGNAGDTVIVQTNNGAPKQRVIALVLPDTLRAHWRTVIPEGANAIEATIIVGHRLLVQDLVDVKNRLRIFGMNGAAQGEVSLPGIGSVGGLSGRADTPELFYDFTSFLYPGTVFRYDFSTKKSVPFQPPHLAFDPSAFETTQVFYASKDGTRIPMFITAKKGTVLDGSHPTVLYAYGGFDINITPAFSSVVAVWLEQGGVYAVPNLRGGGEYGEAWHHAGMLGKKQNVFDDFIAAGEYLIAQKYTSPAHLAIHGYSNGGLLVGAVLDQRPDLFAAAYPGAGVMDMLRYQKFTAGVGWEPEFGSSDDSTQFQWIYKYSPIHNIKAGTCYPATIVTTADHDDRVVPSHSYKFIATLQAAQGCAHPAVIRVETKTSHGYMPTDKLIAELADVWAFTGWNTGMH
jgi:prolyl oligopeptidase